MQLKAKVGESGQELILSSRAVLHMAKHQQNGRMPEAGGQLFGRIEGNIISVEEATGPRKQDVRSRYLYRPNRLQEQAEIDAFFRRKLTFLGDWHTHPESKPKPSFTDLASMQDCFVRSRHHLKAFLLIIIGTGNLPQNMYASLHNETEVLVLKFAVHSASQVPVPSCSKEKEES